MKKNIKHLLLMLCGMFIFQQAIFVQNWSPFPANQKTWFEFSSDNQTLVALYYASNVIEQETETLYYLDANNTAEKLGYNSINPCLQNITGSLTNPMI